MILHILLTLSELIGKGSAVVGTRVCLCHVILLTVQILRYSTSKGSGTSIEIWAKSYATNFDDTVLK